METFLPHRLLMPFSGSGPVGGLDTLLRALLSIPVIQTDVANVLLEKLPEYCADAGNDSSNVFPSLMESMPRLILSQFRWLDYLVDGENVAQKMMEVLSICPIGLQKDIIALIPEIISDSSHELVVRTLEQTLQGNAQLIAPVLDALSNLNLEDEHLDQVFVWIT
jgi:Fanconi anemia group D2 protein